MSLIPNGRIHSGTVIKTEYLPNTNAMGHKIETHWNSESQEEVVVESWMVDGGDGDVMPEFDIISINGVTA